MHLQVVISPHVYGPSVTNNYNYITGQGLYGRLTNSFGYLTKQVGRGLRGPAALICSWPAASCALTCGGGCTLAQQCL
jgi:hypothetical protein